MGGLGLLREDSSQEGEGANAWEANVCHAMETSLSDIKLVWGIRSLPRIGPLTTIVR